MASNVWSHQGSLHIHSEDLNESKDVHIPGSISFSENDDLITNHLKLLAQYIADLLDGLEDILDGVRVGQP